MKHTIQWGGLGKKKNKCCRIPPEWLQRFGAWQPDYYKRYRYNNYSQNGEDGIIEKLFEHLNIKDGYLCEFGAWDGEHLSNTFNLFRDNQQYTPILIEGDENRYEDLVKNMEHRENAHLINKYVDTKPSGTRSLNSIFRELDLPDIKDKFQLLSIDVDGIDYEIWKAFDYCRPKIVIIEVNTQKSAVFNIDHSGAANIENIDHYSPDSGSSLAAMIKLGKEKGYEVVTHCGNVIFVIEELYNMLNIRSNGIADIFDVWLYGWEEEAFRHLFPLAHPDEDSK